MSCLCGCLVRYLFLALLWHGECCRERKPSGGWGSEWLFLDEQRREWSARDLFSFASFGGGERSQRSKLTLCNGELQFTYFIVAPPSPKLSHTILSLPLLLSFTKRGFRIFIGRFMFFSNRQKVFFPIEKGMQRWFPVPKGLTVWKGNGDNTNTRRDAVLG